MNELLAALLGDWLFQNSWIANHKRSQWIPCLVHGFFYGLAFILTGWTLGDSRMFHPLALAFIVISHIVIDRFNLGAFYTRIYNWDWQGDKPKVPLFVCLVCDQSIHLWLNHLALLHL